MFILDLVTPPLQGAGQCFWLHLHQQDEREEDWALRVLTDSHAGLLFCKVLKLFQVLEERLDLSGTNVLPHDCDPEGQWCGCRILQGFLVWHACFLTALILLISSFNQLKN